MLKGDGGIVASLPYRLCNDCWKSHRVPAKWPKGSGLFAEDVSALAASAALIKRGSQWPPSSAVECPSISSADNTWLVSVSRFHAAISSRPLKWLTT
ncbi:hypothetical protein EVAR_57170_1 [Eumeta japonica]|uniref:Uncharacterized protein n=1 Tax=Eumeta variegata TaxID=151549 RepID=A0A4C1ZXE6_EUMVA|nr:hypothetical protein EVAR_57170_1 [Eumeta japonica]